MNDPVHNPSHYKSGGIEVIDVIEAFDLNFRLANVIKYVLRAGRKGDMLQDLEKAAWYLDREIDKLEDKAEADDKRRELPERVTDALDRVVPIDQREYDG
jgi:hypothetical protein